ncbi:hypothetical protein ACTXT7_003811 [Hymenolepis weldensis]
MEDNPSKEGADKKSPSLKPQKVEQCTLDGFCQIDMLVQAGLGDLKISQGESPSSSKQTLIKTPNNGLAKKLIKQLWSNCTSALPSFFSVSK